MVLYIIYKDIKIRRRKILENASKALIIAGAILIAILLTSIGILLINSGKDITSAGTSQMASYEIQAYNAKFTPYEGKNRPVTEACSMIDLITSHNSTNDRQVDLIIDFSSAPGKPGRPNYKNLCTHNYTSVMLEGKIERFENKWLLVKRHKFYKRNN